LKKDKAKQPLLGVFLLTMLCSAAVLLVTVYKNTLLFSPVAVIDNGILDLAIQLRSLTNQNKSITPDDIVIIDIDDVSIEELGRVQLWPRAYDARVIEHVSAGKPKAIGIDILYTESDTLSAAYTDILRERGVENAGDVIRALSTDSLLQSAVQSSGKVFLSLFDDDQSGLIPDRQRLISSLPIIYADEALVNGYTRLVYPVLPIAGLQKAARGIGAISMASELDGVLRKYRLLQALPVEQNKTGEKVPLVFNLAVLMALDGLGVPYNTVEVDKSEIKLGSERHVPVNEKAEFRINWLGESESFRYISFYKVLEKKIPSDFFKDKYVFIGASAAGLQDIKTTPTSRKRIPGVEVHAAALYNILNDSFLHEMPLWASGLLILVFAVALTTLFFFVRPVVGFILMLAIGLAQIMLFLFYVFPEQLLVLPVASLLLLTVLCFITSVVYKYLTQEKDKIRLKAAFETYVAPDLVDQVMQNADSLKLGGQKKQLTVLFSDIRGFTSYSEGLDPEVLVSLLNGYLSRMSEAVLKNKGTIDKFIGDAVMAIFGAPVSQPNHAELACMTALDMLRELEAVNKEQMAHGQPPLQIGIGINTGEMTVGNIGSSRRFDYTVIGDAVNLASRLEGLNKYFKTSILVSEDTKNGVPENKFVFREIGPVRVKGRADTVIVYELMDEQKNTSTHIPLLLRDYNSGLKLYKERQFFESVKQFERCLNIRKNDGPSLLYLMKCRECIANPKVFDPALTMEGK
jgi:adenylate cyclase